MPCVQMHDFTETVYRASRSYLSMRSDGEHWRTGTFHHPEGLVQVHESRSPNHRITALYLTRGGHHFSRRWETVWGDKTIARLAREFIEEVIENEQ